MTVAAWDLLAWLPRAGFDQEGRPTALEGLTCWSDIWSGGNESSFGTLVREVLKTHVDVIVSEPQPFDECEFCAAQCASKCNAFVLIRRLVVFDAASCRLLLLRLRCKSGLHRSPTAALVVQGYMQSQGIIADTFPLSLVGDWREELVRMERFVSESQFNNNCQQLTLNC